MTLEPALEPRRRRGERLLLIAMALLALGFVIAFGARPTVILANAAADDALFVRLARSIASGDWLGPYDHMTLVKGIGFPVFLALLNLLGLPFLTGVALFHAAAAGFASWVVRRLTGSALAAAALFTLLLFAPLFYFGDLTRVVRDVFYASLTLTLVCASIALATAERPRVWAAAATGLVGGWWWLTREEGVWLLPTLALLAVIPLTRPRRGEAPGRRALERLRPAAPALAALAAAIGVVVLVGALNASVYGRFVVNELKDPAFEGALRALQSAGAPYARERVPVPRAARARIYAVSPTFAQLRSPVLDGPLQGRFTAAGCGLDRSTCGDFGGGWFLWVMRDAAAMNGRHRSPGEAAAFYGRIEREVEGACEAGRLSCAAWPLPLVPPTRVSQLDDVAVSAGRVTSFLSFGQPVWTGGLRSDMSAPDAQQMYEFLNRPHHEAGPVRRRFDGWFVGRGQEWFTLRPGPGVAIARFERIASPDLVEAFSDPGRARQRFTVETVCERGAGCFVDMLREGGAVHRIDVSKLGPGQQALGRIARLQVDRAIGGHEGERLFKARFSRGWVAFATSLNPLYRAVVIAGLGAFLLILLRGAARRRLTPLLVVCTALFGAVAARILIIAMIDALSFPAANHAYALPAAPLLLMGAVLALHSVIAEAGQRLQRRRAA